MLQQPDLRCWTGPISTLRFLRMAMPATSWRSSAQNSAGRSGPSVVSCHRSPGRADTRRRRPAARDWRARCGAAIGTRFGGDLGVDRRDQLVDGRRATRGERVEHLLHALAAVVQVLAQLG